MSHALFTVDFELALRSMEEKGRVKVTNEEKRRMSREKLSKAIDDLACLFPNGALDVSVSPSNFIDRVARHIQELRLANKKKDQAIQDYVSWYGICSNAGDHDTYCESTACAYCALARLANGEDG